MLLNEIASKPLIELEIPGSLAGIDSLARNFYWSWHPEATALFESISPDQWAAGVGPIELLHDGRRLKELAVDPSFVRRWQSVKKAFENYMRREPAAPSGLTWEHPVAYFCAEYALHESFPIYSGGLGILAGDHCKEASDMGLPFVAVGCFYHLGFFRQLLSSAERQEHLFPHLPVAKQSLEEVVGKDGQPLRINVSLPGRRVMVRLLKVAVGRVPLLLLDTDIPENAPEARAITAQLYMAGRSMRFHQELVLGVGGTKALEALGIQPCMYHMNEGHSALLLAERFRMEADRQLSLKAAQEHITQTSILTIHTPVTAGNEQFSVKLVKGLLAPTLEGSGLSMAQLLKWGLGEHGDRTMFDMTAFALRLSRMANGVSLLHGHTADDTWRPVVKKPVMGLTNGVHMPTWLGPEMKALFTKLGANFEDSTKLQLTERKHNRATWSPILKAQDAEVWEAHLKQKQHLIGFAQQRLLKRAVRLGEGPDELRKIQELLDPAAFTIGFARRFATYKRAALLFSNPKRLAALLNDPERPVQIIFAGKAHHADGSGQELIAEILRLSKQKPFKNKVILLEDYDMAAGRALVQGVDLWLNNPRRPLEASGTSGMKAAANGVPNASILDGWWDEAVETGADRNGFAIGGREVHKNVNRQDKLDADALFQTLENDVIPLFWKRNREGLPVEWIQVMKRSIATSIYAFSTLRMLEDYASQMYTDPASK